jgi:hypothetical protein
MSVIVRFIILIFCAYAGSLVAGGQFSELPADNYEIARR